MANVPAVAGPGSTYAAPGPTPAGCPLARRYDIGFIPGGSGPCGEGGSTTP